MTLYFKKNQQLQCVFDDTVDSYMHSIMPCVFVDSDMSTWVWVTIRFECVPLNEFSYSKIMVIAIKGVQCMGSKNDASSYPSELAIPN